MQKRVSIVELKQLRGIFTLHYDKIIIYSKGGEILVLSDLSGSFNFNISSLSRYENGLRSSSKYFFLSKIRLFSNGSKVIRIGKKIYLGAELYFTDLSGVHYNHAQKSGCIDLVFKKGVKG